MCAGSTDRCAENMKSTRRGSIMHASTAPGDRCKGRARHGQHAPLTRHEPGADSAVHPDVVKTEHIGAFIGGLSSIMDIGHSSGPFVAGLIITVISTSAGFFAAAAVCVLGALAFATFAFVR